MEHLNVKKDLIQINQEILSILGRIRAVSGASHGSTAQWMDICQRIDAKLREETARIAVVGAIKSGKSTLINSLFSGDYLKRGAGVVTAMVTKIRRGPQLKAKLFFKSWEEIHSDIERAMVLLPSMKFRSDQRRFDIRNESDRKALEDALGSLERKLLISNDMRNLNSLYLSYYLKGFERVKHFLEGPTLEQVYVHDDFFKHHDFSGNEVMALYVKDISLEIDSGDIDENVEIADCQGSDSPNPLHMAMIQDYLNVANLLIYVISSRTGIRQADINFLSMIKKMGLMDHILFVVNIDLSEHLSFEELGELIDKIKEDLSLIKPNPQVYAYSALFSLFQKQRVKLHPRDLERLTQWEKETVFCEFSQRQEADFIRKFHEVVMHNRHQMLFLNHLDRLQMMVTGIYQWIAMKLDVFNKNVDEVSDLLTYLNSQQIKVNRLKSLVKSTLDGAVVEMKRNVRGDIDRFFDKRSGEVLPDLIGFVNDYAVGFHQYKDQLASAGFADTLYLVFQEFTHAIDAFMAQEINPRIFKFIKGQEESICDFFDSIAGPYETMAREMLSEYNKFMEKQGIVVESANPRQGVQTDLTLLKHEKGLALPPASATMNYSLSIKTEALARLGVYHIIHKIRQLIHKPAQGPIENALSALKDAVSRMKKETVSSLIFHFKNYNENIKFQYIFKLIDIISEHLFAGMMERFHNYAQDLTEVMHQTALQREDQSKATDFLKAIHSEVAAVSHRISLIQQQIYINNDQAI